MREVTEDEYVDKGSIASGSNTIIGTYDIVLAYAVKVVATDAVGNSAVFASIIETSNAIIDIMKGGEGMALGMMASKPDTLQIGYGKVDIEEGVIEVNHVDTESGNRIKTTIGSQNGYYSHYYTTAPNGHYFGQKVTVDNELIVTGHAEIGSEKVNGSLEVNGNLFGKGVFTRYHITTLSNTTYTLVITPKTNTVNDRLSVLIFGNSNDTAELAIIIVNPKKNLCTVKNITGFITLNTYSFSDDGTCSVTINTNNGSDYTAISESNIS